VSGRLILSVNTNVLVTRTEQFFLDRKRRPSIWLVAPIAVASIAFTFAAVYWPRSFSFGSDSAIAGIGWAAAGIIWAYRLFFLIVTELVKLFLYQLLQAGDIRAFVNRFNLLRNRRKILEERILEDGFETTIKARLDMEKAAAQEEAHSVRLEIDGLKGQVAELEKFKEALKQYFEGSLTASDLKELTL